MDTTIDQQVAMDEALVPHARRLRIGRSNFHLLSDISSKESTLQLVYYVLRLTPFFKDFLVIAAVPEIYMQEFWATATIHHHSIRFKMDNKKHIVNLESFREMLHICPRLPGQSFVEHKDTKKSNEMYYPRSTKVIIYHFLLKDPSIPRRKKVNWHYVRDDHMLTTIKLVSRHQNTQQFGAMLPIELTNVDIRNSDAYKEYYEVATGATPPKTKASVRKTKSSSDTTPEWSRHVTIVHHTKDLHTADYTQLYDFLKYNQKEVDELKAKRLAKTQDPLALMENSNNPYAFPPPHQDQSELLATTNAKS
nr:hypothetical protein [Tanacetum cinerariifolium]